MSRLTWKLLPKAVGRVTADGGAPAAGLVRKPECAPRGARALGPCRERGRRHFFLTVRQSIPRRGAESQRDPGLLKPRTALLPGRAVPGCRARSRDSVGRAGGSPGRGHVRRCSRSCPYERAPREPRPFPLGKTQRGEMQDPICGCCDLTPAPQSGEEQVSAISKLPGPCRWLEQPEQTQGSLDYAPGNTGLTAEPQQPLWATRLHIHPRVRELGFPRRGLEGPGSPWP